MILSQKRYSEATYDTSIIHEHERDFHVNSNLQNTGARGLSLYTWAVYLYIHSKRSMIKAASSYKENVTSYSRQCTVHSPGQ